MADFVLWFVVGLSARVAVGFARSIVSVIGYHTRSAADPMENIIDG